MAIEVNSLMTVSDPSRLSSDFHDTVHGALMEAGALEVNGYVGLSGPMTGMAGLQSRWESLGQWAEASAAMEATMTPGGAMAEMAERYQLAQRIIGTDMLEAGNPSGAFVIASRYSFTAAPQGLDNAAKLALAAGANGLRIMSVLAGGDMTGHIIGATFLDSLDAMPGVLASITSDAQFVADVQAAGGHLESRTIFRVI